MALEVSGQVLCKRATCSLQWVWYRKTKSANRPYDYLHILAIHKHNTLLNHTKRILGRLVGGSECANEWTESSLPGLGWFIAWTVYMFFSFTISWKSVCKKVNIVNYEASIGLGLPTCCISLSVCLSWLTILWALSCTRGLTVVRCNLQLLTCKNILLTHQLSCLKQDIYSLFKHVANYDTNFN